MKGPLERSAGADARIIPIERPALTRVRRRHETHWLALVSGAALLFVAVTVAKPWGGDATPRYAATPDSSGAVAGASHTIDPWIVRKEPGNGDPVWTCFDPDGMASGGQIRPIADPSGPSGGIEYAGNGPGIVAYQWSVVAYRWIQVDPTVPLQSDPGASPGETFYMGGRQDIGPIADPSAAVATCVQWVVV